MHYPNKSVSDVHPDAILKVLQDSSERSPYGVPENQAKIERHVAKRQQREEERSHASSAANERYSTMENRLDTNGLQGATITPHKWPSITPITPLFRRALDLYNT